MCFTFISYAKHAIDKVIICNACTINIKCASIYITFVWHVFVLSGCCYCLSIHNLNFIVHPIYLFSFIYCTHIFIVNSIFTRATTHFQQYKYQSGRTHCKENRKKWTNTFAICFLMKTIYKNAQPLKWIAEEEEEERKTPYDRGWKEWMANYTQPNYQLKIYYLERSIKLREYFFFFSNFWWF